mmetsp:Transcript_23392/g.88821  ORF Transcript_23392/g.88821 Transcript_23392/m.88821 type:complete len:217 (-) Transcript_23392:329-979(-)
MARRGMYAGGAAAGAAGAAAEQASSGDAAPAAPAAAPASGDAGSTGPEASAEALPAGVTPKKDRWAIRAPPSSSLSTDGRSTSRWPVESLSSPVGGATRARHRRAASPVRNAGLEPVQSRPTLAPSLGRVRRHTAPKQARSPDSASHELAAEPAPAAADRSADSASSTASDVMARSSAAPGEYWSLLSPRRRGVTLTSSAVTTGAAAGVHASESVR